jgi:hypothetical protein
MKLGFLDRVSKNAHMSYFMKILLVENELFRADSRTCGGTERLTDIYNEANGSFYNFANAPNNCKPSDYVKLLGFVSQLSFNEKRFLSKLCT